MASPEKRYITIGRPGFTEKASGRVEDGEPVTDLLGSNITNYINISYYTNGWVDGWRERGGAVLRCSLGSKQLSYHRLCFCAPVKVEHGARRDGVALDQGGPPQCWPRDAWHQSSELPSQCACHKQDDVVMTLRVRHELR